MIGVQIFSDHSSQRFTLMAIVECNEGGMYRPGGPVSMQLFGLAVDPATNGMYPGPC
jgi:hypothetical protein